MSAFLTHHGTFLCFGTERGGFQHLPLEEVEPAVLVLADASAASIRAGLPGGEPIGIRPQSGARLGLPRALGVANGHRRPAVALLWREAYLCAGGTGGTIMRSERVSDWEEFLPVAVDDVALLRSLAEGAWEMERDGRRLGAGAIRLEPNFTLRAGEVVFDLRLMPSLGGAAALARGRASLLVDGWRIERLRRYAPLVVWRHDGSEHADEEIIVGLQSMVPFAADVRVLVETSLGEAELRARVPALESTRLDIRTPPPGRRGLLAGLAGVSESAAPVLLLANGVLCCGSLQPLLKALASERDVALLAWRWTPDGPVADEGSLFANDPSEGADAVPCSAAVIGLPDRASALFGLIGAIAANRPPPERARDTADDDLLRYVLAREGGGCTRLLERHVRTGADTPAGTASLLNLRPVPPEIRLLRMRALLEG